MYGDKIEVACAIKLYTNKLECLSLSVNYTLVYYFVDKAGDYVRGATLQDTTLRVVFQPSHKY